MQFRELNNKYTTTSIRTGIIRGKSADSTLDSATLVLSHISKIDIEVNDIVDLTNEFGTHEYWLVASYEAKYITKEEPYIYDYTINLMELTYLLSCCILPNMTITQTIGRKTIYYIRAVTNYYFKCDYNLNLNYSNTIMALDTVAPVGRFTEPTLKEYLDYLLSFDNYSVKLEYKNGGFIITTKDLNPTSSKLFDTKYVTEMIESQTADDYLDTIVTSSDEIISSSYITEVHKLKTDGSIFNSSNASMYLHYKPYDISKVEVVKYSRYTSDYITFKGDATNLAVYYSDITSSGVTWTSYASSTAVIIYPNATSNSISIQYSSSGSAVIHLRKTSIDITNNVLVSDVYNSRDILGQGSIQTKIMENKAYRNNSIQWSRGSNELSGFHAFESKKVVWTNNDKTAIQMAVFCNALKPTGYSPVSGYTYKYGEGTLTIGDGEEATTHQYVIVGNKIADTWTIEDNCYDYTRLALKITYKPYISVRFKQYNGKTHTIEKPNSNTNASTDLIKLWEQNTIKNKQLGNPLISFYATSPVSDGIVFEIGQIFNSYKLNKIEYSINNSVITWKGTLSKNYANRDINTTLNTEKRYYALPSASESVIRNECRGIDGSDYDNSLFTGQNLCLVCTRDGQIGTLPVNRIKINNYLYMFTFQMTDNVIVGSTTGDSIFYSNAYIVPTKNIKYVDDNGEQDYLLFYIISASDYNLLESADYGTLNLQLTESKRIKFELGSSSSSNWLKDARETVAVTLVVER